MQVAGAISASDFQFRGFVFNGILKRDPAAEGTSGPALTLNQFKVLSSSCLSGVHGPRRRLGFEHDDSSEVHEDFTRKQTD